jgi:hypothetical protein
MARCSSCDAPVLWAVSAASGIRTPLNPDPHPEGNLIPVNADGTPLSHATAASVVQSGRARVASLAASARAGHQLPELRWHAHFVTCPNGARHRKTRAG